MGDGTHVVCILYVYATAMLNSHGVGEVSMCTLFIYLSLP